MSRSGGSPPGGRRRGLDRRADGEGHQGEANTTRQVEATPGESVVP